MIENAVLQNMKARFCCRSFKSDAVEREKLEAILEAGKYAASGHNAQGWHFTVITTEEGKSELLDAVCPEPPELRNWRLPVQRGPSLPTFSAHRWSL